MSTPESLASGGIHTGDVGGNVTFSALGDIVGGNKITYITQTTQISVESVTQKELVTASPYRGLDRFEDRDKDVFFGRDQSIKSLLGQLSTSNVLLVLGASGSGKSSIVRAGLLPTLARLMGARFRYFTFVPDVNPFESLRSALHGAGFSQSQTALLLTGDSDGPCKVARTLQRDGDQWLFFVDQFEEIFTTTDEARRKSFLAALVTLAKERESATKLVLAMRADFFDRFSPFPEFAKLVEKHIDFVADMHRDELRLAIEQPAARNGVVFETGLVDEIIKNIEGQAGSLPLLQYTLDLLWETERSDGGLSDRHLNAKSYRELGGVRGALQKRAETIYDSFSDGADGKKPSPRQEIVRQIFLRLVDVAGKGDDDALWRPVRRRVPMLIFQNTEETEILRALIDQKLLVSNREGNDATVEVAHEALFTSWERVRKWIEGGKEVIFMRNRLTDDARRWQERRKKGDADADEELLKGTRLQQALELRARGDFTTILGGLADAETQFLDTSAAERDRHAREEKERQQRELEAARRLADARALAATRLRTGLIASAVLLALSVAGAIWGWTAQGTAKRNATAARAAERTAVEETKNAKRALSQSDFQRAADLLDQKKTREALAYLARACRTDPENSSAATRLFSLLAETNWILPVTPPAVVKNGGGFHTILDHARFSPDGKTIVATSWDSPGFGSPEGHAYIAHFKDGALAFLPASIPCNATERKSFDEETKSCRPDERGFSPREPLVLIPHRTEVQVCDSGNGDIRQPILTHATDVTAAEFIEDGAAILTGCADGRVTVWDAKTGQQRGNAMQLKSRVLRFSRTGNYAASAGEDGSRKIWRFDLSRPTVAEMTHDEVDGIVGDDREVLVVSKYADPDADFSRGHRTTVMTPSRDGNRFVLMDVRVENHHSPTATGELYLWRRNGQSLQEILGGPSLHTPQPYIAVPEMGNGLGELLRVYRAIFSPDGRRVASVAFKEAVRIWDSNRGSAVNEPLWPDTPPEATEPEFFSDVSFSPDGTRILTTSYFGMAQVWEVRPTAPTHEPVVIEIEGDGVKGVGFGEGCVTVWNSSFKESFFDPNIGRRLEAKPAETGVATDASVNQWKLDLQNRNLTDPVTGRKVLDFSLLGNVKEAAVTPKGVITAAVEDKTVILDRFDYRLERAPRRLAEAAEAFARMKLDENGSLRPHLVLVSQLAAIQAPEGEQEPAVFTQWWKWLTSPRDGNRPVAPGSKTSLAAYVQKALETSKNEAGLKMLDQAELLSVGEPELLQKIAMKRAELAGEKTKLP